jgi:hypothetical protein
MRTTRLVTGLVTTGLAVTGPVLLAAAPAHAVTTVPSTVTVDPLSSTALTYGDDIYISGKVTGPDGDSPNTPTSVFLQVSTPSNPTWTTVGTDDSGYFFFDNVTPQTNATYKVVFPGGTEGYGGSVKTMAAGESAPIAVTVARKVDARTKDLKVIGKVTPDFAKKKLKILQVLKHNKTKRYATVKTNKKGKFSFRAPRKNKFKFILLVPADANYAAVANRYIVHVY